MSKKTITIDTAIHAVVLKHPDSTMKAQPDTESTQDQDAFEDWSKREGGLNLMQAREYMCEDGRFPATYHYAPTETAWRAWANKPNPDTEVLKARIAELENPAKQPPRTNPLKENKVLHADPRNTLDVIEQCMEGIPGGPWTSIVYNEFDGETRSPTIYTLAHSPHKTYRENYLDPAVTRQPFKVCDMPWGDQLSAYGLDGQKKESLALAEYFSLLDPTTMIELIRLARIGVEHDR